MNALQRSSLEETSGWEQRYCMTVFCEETVLFVQRCEDQSDLWRIASQPSGATWLVAAVEPICPCCGGKLALPTDYTLN